MGRKKRKAPEAAEEPQPVPAAVPPMDPRRKPPTTAAPPAPAVVENSNQENTTSVVEKTEDDAAKALKSGYAMTTHSAEIIDEDIYVSDGSDEDEDEKVALRDMEMVLAGSRMGIMRRGIHHPMLVQPNRQWVKEDKSKVTEAEDAEDDEAEKKRQQEEEEELAKLDPAQRAARLLAEKQRKLEEAKVTARRVESEENAGRDPCLFSKRTAFDIRFDQIDDKPWLRGDLTDFFNYGLTEDDWLEYAQHQIMIRQELTDASRQRRAPDPTVVPVTPRAPTKQTPKVAVAVKTDSTTGEGEESNASPTAGGNTMLGPAPMETEEDESSKDKDPSIVKVTEVPAGLGGAWGAGAAPGSMLAKLIEEQEQQQHQQDSGRHFGNNEEDSKYGPAGGGGHRGGRSRNDQSFDQGGDTSYYGNGGDSYGGGQQQWDQYGGGHRGGRGGGGRGYYGGGGGGRGGRGGRGGYRDRSHQGRGGGYQDGGDYYRKRPRDDYGDSRGGWRR